MGGSGHLGVRSPGNPPRCAGRHAPCHIRRDSSVAPERQPAAAEPAATRPASAPPRHPAPAGGRGGTARPERTIDVLVFQRADIGHHRGLSAPRSARSPAVPVGEKRRDVEPEHQHQRRCVNTGSKRRHVRLALRRGAEDHRMQAAEEAGEGHAKRRQQDRREPGLLLHRGGQDQELAGEHPERRKAGDRQRRRSSTPNPRRVGCGSGRGCGRWTACRRYGPHGPR